MKAEPKVEKKHSYRKERIRQENKETPRTKFETDKWSLKYNYGNIIESEKASVFTCQVEWKTTVAAPQPWASYSPMRDEKKEA